MTERDRQTEFLMRVLALADCKDEAGLQTRIHQAQHDEQCLRFAFTLVGLIGGAALAGLGYCAVLHPEFFDNSTPTLVKIFCAVGLGSFICMLVFFGCWLWYRSASNKVYEACRQRVLDAIQTRLKSHPSPVFVQTLDFSLPVPAKQERRSAAG
ncbi:MAG TPA: hypothetical protein VJ063_08350 [Verrucomicrobiae bacterium]|nr:hypothetical protein [Verrucomicrobiae bacterium]